MSKKKNTDNEGIALSEIAPLAEEETALSAADDGIEQKDGGEPELSEQEKKAAKRLLGTLIGVIVVAIVVGGVLCYRFYFKDYFQEKKLAAQVEAAVSGADVQIKEDLYVSWINEIYTNTDQYLGKKISIEGMYKSESFDGNPQTYYYVYRVGPGCCGNDGSTCGFELMKPEVALREKDWVKVVGTLDRYEEKGTYYLYLKDPTIVVDNDHRGTETVKL